MKSPIAWSLFSRHSLAVVAMAMALVLVGVPAATGLPPDRDPSAQEKEILNRYTGAVDSLLDSFTNETWEEDEGHRFELGANVMVSNDPDVPFNINESIERQYQVRRDSKVFAEKYGALLAKIEQTSDINEKMKLSEQLPYTRVRVRVYFNQLNFEVKPAPPGNAPLALRGPALAYGVAAESNRSAAVLLLFGDWQNATWDAKNHWYHYHFQRRGFYPAIENIVIQVDGNPDRVDELLHTANWAAINDGLVLGKP